PARRFVHPVESLMRAGRPRSQSCDMPRAMRLWLSKSSEVPLREQLVTQIRLGIVSGDLETRQRLPSTRELARRFRIHANTVSAAYRELHRNGWVDFRKGSGVYVREYSADQRKEIGRASCRERVERSEEGVRVNKKKEN